MIQTNNKKLSTGNHTKTRHFDITIISSNYDKCPKSEHSKNVMSKMEIIMTGAQYYKTEMGDRMATRDIGRKLRGCCAPFHGGGDPDLTQCRLGRGLLPYQVASSSIQPFDHNRHGPKIGGAAVPLFWGSWVPQHKMQKIR